LLKNGSRLGVGPETCMTLVTSTAQVPGLALHLSSASNGVYGKLKASATPR